MRISVFGLGYVGAVTGACFAKEGHEVIGVDVDPAKVELIRSGKSPIVEEGIQELVQEVVEAGLFTATTDCDTAVNETDVTLISVGTPSRASGSLDLAAVEAVAEQIGQALRNKDSGHTIIVRSTLLPGTTRRVVLPILERASGKTCGDGFHICYNPEFLREGSSIKDFYNAPYTVIGSSSEGAAELVGELYSSVKAEQHYTSIEVAEAMKYVCNAFHALKVSFANEIGVITKSLGVDSHPVMELVCKDTKLNISPAYLRPGFAFGGSCLPKDVRALVYAGMRNDLRIPLMQSLLPSNDQHLNRAVRLVLDTGERDIALLGLSFKPGTDDLRESPLVRLSEQLIGKGMRLKIYDPGVVLSCLTGANRAYIDRELPHIGELLTDNFGEVLEHAKVAVVGNWKICDEAQMTKWVESNTIIDLERVPDSVANTAAEYRGISWWCEACEPVTTAP